MPKQDLFSRIILCGLFCLVFILAFSVMIHVPLQGDDYYYHTIAEKSGMDFWREHLHHYTEVNGRAMVHLLVTLFLKAPPILWQVFCALLLAAIAVLSVRPFIKAGHRVQNLLCAGLGLSVIPALRPEMTRESVYWLTGACNYVFPFFLLLLFWHLLYREDARGRLYLLPILAFLSGATTEQNGMMTVGIAVLFFLDKRLNQKNKADRASAAALIASFFGMLSVFLSPATSLRYGLETDAGVLATLADHLPTVFYWFLSREYTVHFVLFFCIAAALFLLAKARETNRPWLYRLYAVLYLPAAIVVIYLSKTIVDVWEPRILLGMAVFLLCTLPGIACTLQYILTKRPVGYLFSLTALVLAVGSQLMMTVSPVLGARTMLCGVLLLFIFSTSLLAFAFENTRMRPLLCGMVLLFLLGSLQTHVITWQGYRANAAIAAENQRRITAYMDGDTQQLTLQKNAEENCGWSMPYTSEYHLYYFKVYFGLPSDTEILWEGCP